MLNGRGSAAPIPQDRQWVTLRSAAPIPQDRQWVTLAEGKSDIRNRPASRFYENMLKLDMGGDPESAFSKEVSAILRTYSYHVSHFESFIEINCFNVGCSVKILRDAASGAIELTKDIVRSVPIPDTHEEETVTVINFCVARVSFTISTLRGEEEVPWRAFVHGTWVYPTKRAGFDGPLDAVKNIVTGLSIAGERQRVAHALELTAKDVEVAAKDAELAAKDAELAALLLKITYLKEYGAESIRTRPTPEVPVGWAPGDRTSGKDDAAERAAA